MTTLPDVLPLLGLEGIVLKAGGHATRGIDSVCAMEAVAWIAGEPHSDHPQCACPVIGAFMRSWNDGLPTDEDRARWLRPLIPSVVGTKATVAVERTRSYLALDWFVREHTPAWLSLTESLRSHATALRGLAPLTDATSCHRAQPVIAAAGDAARDAARVAAMDAAGDAARDAAWDAARVAAMDALRLTVVLLQASAVDLVKRMIAVQA